MENIISYFRPEMFTSLMENLTVPLLLAVATGLLMFVLNNDSVKKG